MSKVKHARSRRNVIVSVYAVRRLYGGPEEGGWWFNDYAYTGRSLVRRPGKARRTQAHVNASLVDEQPRYSIYSAANRGEAEFVALIERRPGERASEGRPYYE